MGTIFSYLFSRLKDKKILLLGLDSAGKTTILYKLKMGEMIKTIPTIGFNVEEIVYNTMRLTVWDVGGQEKIRCLWRHYYKDTSAVIFVIDISDSARFAEAKEELHTILNEDQLKDVPVLIFANKSDLSPTVSASQLVSVLDLTHLKNTQWYVQLSSAIKELGLYEGLEWLSNTLEKN